MWRPKSRIPARYLEHEIAVEIRDDVPTSSGDSYAAVRPAAALVVDKVAQVVDMRADSDSRGEVITATTQAVLDLSWGVITPGSLVTHQAGTPWERKLEVVAVAANEHSIVPSTIQLWMQ